jgi:selenocysteine-specific elongation factor
MVTIGGGQILDTYPPRHRRSDKGVVEKLRVLRDGTLEERVMFWIEDSGLASTDLPRLVARLGVPAAAVRDHIAKLVKAGRVRTILENPFTVVAEAEFKNAVNRTLAEVKQFHQQNPLVQGISREELRNRVLSEAPNIVFQSVLDQLVAGKQVVVAQDTIQEFGRKVTLKGGEEQIRNQLIERFQTLGLRIPTPDELIDALKADRTTARKIVQLLIKENVLVKISDDFILHRETIDKLVASVKELKSKNPKLGVGEFKDLTGVTRKYAIPLLEYLDRQRVTRRVGEDRLIL